MVLARKHLCCIPARTFAEGFEVRVVGEAMMVLTNCNSIQEIFICREGFTKQSGHAAGFSTTQLLQQNRAFASPYSSSTLAFAFALTSSILRAPLVRHGSHVLIQA